jgi:hypothetical protein
MLNPDREYLEAVTLAALRHEGFEPQIIRDREVLDCYCIAAGSSTTEHFMVSDNDMIPGRAGFYREAFGVLERNASLGALGFAYKRNIKAGEYGIWFIADRGEYWEMDHIGGILFFRREAVPSRDEIQPYDFKAGLADDKVLSYAIRKRGFHVGIAPHLYQHHLGEYLSTLWPG